VDLTSPSAVAAVGNELGITATTVAAATVDEM
jgi:2-hydroxychromene-2-carboxylate isomerase